MRSTMPGALSRPESVGRGRYAESRPAAVDGRERPTNVVAVQFVVKGKSGEPHYLLHVYHILLLSEILTCIDYSAVVFAAREE